MAPHQKRNTIAVLVIGFGLLFLVRDQLCTFVYTYWYGLHWEWSYGASSTVPTVTVYARWNGKEIECPYYFGGISKPSMVLRDITGDGFPDLRWSNGRERIVVSFVPGKGEEPPRFGLVEDTTGRGLN